MSLGAPPLGTICGSFFLKKKTSTLLGEQNFFYFWLIGRSMWKKYYCLPFVKIKLSYVIGLLILPLPIRGCREQMIKKRLEIFAHLQQRIFFPTLLFYSISILKLVLKGRKKLQKFLIGWSKKNSLF